ncbi:hypothetical protein [Caproiciproducens sp. LBM24188]
MDTHLYCPKNFYLMAAGAARGGVIFMASLGKGQKADKQILLDALNWTLIEL